MTSLSLVQPPHSRSSEEAALGAVLIDSNAYYEIASIIKTEEAFYVEKHRHVWRAMGELEGAGVAIDIVTLTQKLGDTGLLTAAGGMSFVANLASMTPTAANVEFYAKIITRKHAMRVSKEAALNVLSAIEKDTDPQALWSKFSDTIDKANGISIDAGAMQQSAALHEAWMHLKGVKAKLTSSGLIGITTGFRDIDKLSMGFQKGHMIILAARPAMGKTSLMLQYVLAAASEVHKTNKANSENGVVVVLSLEMAVRDLVLRMMSFDSGIDGGKLRTLKVSQGDEIKIQRTIKRLNPLPIEYFPSVVCTPALLISRLRSLSSKRDVKAVFIDYLQLMRSGRSTSKYEDVTEVSRALKMIATAFDIPVIVLAQLSRACENRPDRRPILSDLRDSGAIEQDADMVSFLYREDYYRADPQDHDGFADLIIGKWRYGKTGSLRLGWDGPTTSFSTVKQP